MLALIFRLEEHLYGVAADRILEVLPLAELREQVGSPAHLRGLLLLRGRALPVIDCCQLLCHSSCPSRIGTRILHLDCEFGLMVPTLSDPVHLAPEKGRSLGKAAPYLGQLWEAENIQLLRPEGISIS